MKLVTYIIGFILLFQPVFPVLEYVVRYDYFAEVLCENQDKPALACHGKCQLAKNIAATQKEDKKGNLNPEIIQLNGIFEVFSYPILSLMPYEYSIGYEEHTEKYHSPNLKKEKAPPRLSVI